MHKIWVYGSNGKLHIYIYHIKLYHIKLLIQNQIIHILNIIIT